MSEELDALVGSYEAGRLRGRRMVSTLDSWLGDPGLAPVRDLDGSSRPECAAWGPFWRRVQDRLAELE